MKRLIITLLTINSITLTSIVADDISTPKIINIGDSEATPKATFSLPSNLINLLANPDTGDLTLIAGRQYILQIDPSSSIKISNNNVIELSRTQDSIRDVTVIKLQAKKEGNTIITVTRPGFYDIHYFCSIE